MSVGTLKRRRRLVDDATQALRDAILNGRLREGAHLRQTDLADQLGISRTPIREALSRLHQEGLVELLPRGGVQVVLLNVDDAMELYDLREVLDGLAARLAAQRAEAAILGRMERALTGMAQCLERQDANQWFPAHVLFHDEIFRMAGNTRLQKLLTIVHLSIRRFHPLLLKTEGRLQAAYDEHCRIFQAIAARDPEAAEREARSHIADAKEIVLKFMAKAAPDATVQA